MVYPSKGVNDQALTMERVCKLYDEDAWYSVKGSKGKRSGTQFAAYWVHNLKVIFEENMQKGYGK